MRRTTITFGSVGTAGLVTTALLAWPVSSAHADDDTAIKRDEDTPDVVLVADDDDDDTADRVAGGDTNTRSRNSRSRNSNDATNSRHTGVSRDRDHSRGDRTKDWTRDGGDGTRDRSAGHTNDRSRNDTRR